MTEDQKYQGALYKDKTKKQKTNKAANPPQSAVTATAAVMSQQAYVEDIGEDREYESWDEDDGATDDEHSPAEPPPEAPTPPSAAIDDDNVNVFDFLVATGQTPNASNMNLAQEERDVEVGESTSLVRYEYNAEEYLDPTSLMEDDDEPLVQYGSGPIPGKGGPFVTPATKSERRRSKESELKKDKKRKRLHVDVPRDEVMTDAPPVLHSGLTGGLKGLMRPTLPPSPDYSGGDIASPASPLKKSRHSKSSKDRQVSNSLFGMLTGTTKKRKKVSTKKRSHRTREEKESKLIEFRPQSKDGKTDDADAEGQLVVYKPRADVFLGFVNKGPDSERGCSMNKALKRFHRVREATGTNLTKGKEEKELWRSLRLRRNDRGEIVLFSEDLDLDNIDV